MQYNITLNLMTYIMVLIAFGTIGSCYQAYKERSSTKPFVARIICGSFAGSVTLLVVYILRMQEAPAAIHFGLAVLLGLVAEKGEGARIVDLVFNRGGSR